MPAWWSRKSNKNKEESHHHSLFSDLNSKKSSINSDNLSTNSNDKRSPRSLEELGHHGILSPNLRGTSSGISGCDSDGERKVVGHPLPRPSSSNCGGFVVVDHGHGGGGGGLIALGSASISSVSSSGSNSDDPPLLLDHFQSGINRFSSSFDLFYVLG
ncbi:unnamed protein product [Amaranthus hypochondriacus]